MVENTFQLHRDGSKQVINGVVPSNHAMHETLEITHGFTGLFETGFYVFTSISPAFRRRWWNWWAIIRPRLTAPESWHLPVA